jgi:hypothetical protein
MLMMLKKTCIGILLETIVRRWSGIYQACNLLDSSHLGPQIGPKCLKSVQTDRSETIAVEPVRHRTSAMS